MYYTTVIHSIYLCRTSCTSCSSGYCIIQTWACGKLRHYNLGEKREIRSTTQLHCSSEAHLCTHQECILWIWFLALPSTSGALQRKKYTLCILGFNHSVLWSKCAESKYPGHSEHTLFLSQYIDFWQSKETSLTTWVNILIRSSVSCFYYTRQTPLAVAAQMRDWT